MEEKVKHKENASNILKKAKTVAVIGISPKKDRPSYYVTEKVLKKGRHKVYLVNPRYAGENILGLRVFSSLKEIDEPVDIVNVFRNPSFAEEIVREAIEVGAKYVWFQPGAENFEVIEKYKGRIEFIYEACIGVEADYLS